MSSFVLRERQHTKDELTDDVIDKTARDDEMTVVHPRSGSGIRLQHSNPHHQKLKNDLQLNFKLN